MVLLTLKRMFHQPLIAYFQLVLLQAIYPYFSNSFHKIVLKVYVYVPLVKFITAISLLLVPISCISYCCHYYNQIYENRQLRVIRIYFVSQGKQDGWHSNLGMGAYAWSYYNGRQEAERDQEKNEQNQVQTTSYPQKPISAIQALALYSFLFRAFLVYQFFSLISHTKHSFPPPPPLFSSIHSSTIQKGAQALTS